MNVQTITTPAGDRMVILSEPDYQALISAAEDSVDRVAVDLFRSRLVAGAEELVPAIIADRILEGENRIRVWRDYREMTLTNLADQAGIGVHCLSEIEAGEREGTIATMRKIADILSVTLDDLVG